MNYVAYLHLHKLDISVTEWLNTQVGPQALRWKMFVDEWDRCVVLFTEEKDCIAFKERFKI